MYEGEEHCWKEYDPPRGGTDISVVLLRHYRTDGEDELGITGNRRKIAPWSPPALGRHRWQCRSHTVPPALLTVNVAAKRSQFMRGFPGDCGSAGHCHPLRCTAWTHCHTAPADRPPAGGLQFNVAHEIRGQAVGAGPRHDATRRCDDRHFREPQFRHVGLAALAHAERLREALANVRLRGGPSRLAAEGTSGNHPERSDKSREAPSRVSRLFCF